MADSKAVSGATAAGESEPHGIVARVLLYIRQVIEEMRKVVYPSREELTSYTIAVLVFLGVIMAYVNGLDWVITRAITWVFGTA